MVESGKQGVFDFRGMKGEGELWSFVANCGELWRHCGAFVEHPSSTIQRVISATDRRQPVVGVEVGVGVGWDCSADGGSCVFMAIERGAGVNREGLPQRCITTD